MTKGDPVPGLETESFNLEATPTTLTLPRHSDGRKSKDTRGQSPEGIGLAVNCAGSGCPNSALRDYSSHPAGWRPADAGPRPVTLAEP